MADGPTVLMNGERGGSAESSPDCPNGMLVSTTGGCDGAGVYIALRVTLKVVVTAGVGATGG